MKKNIIGGRIKRCRLRLKFSPEELSQRLAVQGCIISAARIMKIEHREVPIYDSQVLALSKVLKVTIHWLVTGREFRGRKQARVR